MSKRPDQGRAPLQDRPRRRRWPWVLLGLFVFLASAGTGAMYAAYLYYSYDLPKLDVLSDYRPKVISRIFADDGAVIAEFYEERREVVPLQRIPMNLINAFVAAEDSKFFQHPGIDFLAIVRAALRNLEAGRVVQGASTITQQVCKSLLLTPEKAFSRKIREAILAYRIENRFSKMEILYLYLNQIYLGEGAYGVAVASQVYFNKPVESLTLAECAMLAGVTQAPSRYSPRSHPDRARRRQLYVLGRMVEDGFITPAQAEAAKAETVAIYPSRPRHFLKAPYFTEHIRRMIEAKYGRDRLMNDGLKVYTTVDLRMQDQAEEAVRRGLAELDKREGFRGPLDKLKPEQIKAFMEKLAGQIGAEDLVQGSLLTGVVVEVSPQQALVSLGRFSGRIPVKELGWARKPNPNQPYYQAKITDAAKALQVGDVVLVRLLGRNNDETWNLALEQEPLVQGALVCLEAATGHVKALVGGRDFNQSQFNRALQAKRQPGSAFKPFIYAAALDKGYTPASVLLDAPVVYRLPGDKVWKPRNFQKQFFGPTTFRVALEKSRNVITVRLLESIGVNYAIDYAQKLGLDSDFTPNLSLALGSNEVTVLEMAKAYSTFCNLGQRTEPVFVTRVEDRNGLLLEEAVLEREQVIGPNTAYIMTHLLEGVVSHGTGWRIRALKRPVAGKTGTTNDLKDAWFVGFTPDLVTAVWVGYDDVTPMGADETGSVAAAPPWLYFMQAALAGKPVKAFKVPQEVAFARVDRRTGLLAGPGSASAVLEAFKPGTAPSLSTAKPQTKDQEFLKKDI